MRKGRNVTRAVRSEVKSVRNSPAGTQEEEEEGRRGSRHLSRGSLAAGGEDWAGAGFPDRNCGHWPVHAGTGAALG